MPAYNEKQHKGLIEFYNIYMWQLQTQLSIQNDTKTYTVNSARLLKVQQEVE